MKKCTLSCLILSLVLVGSTSFASAIGNVVTAEGTATAHGSDGFTRSLDTGSPVFLLDRIVTGPASKVQIRFEDDTMVNQGERSELVINEYVYSPDQPSQNRSFMKLVDGIFRIVTDKITKLNPERFEVKTNYGTIGIRGCDLAFNLTGSEEKVAVLALHTADSVVIKTVKAPAGGSAKRASALTITEDGILASISELEGITSRPITEHEVQEIQEKTSPRGLASSSLVLPAFTPQAKNETLMEQDVTEAQESVDTTSQNVTVKLDAEPPADVVVEDEPEEETQQDSSSNGGGSTGTPSAPEFPVTLPRETLASGSGQDWSWDVWQQETFDLVEDGQLVSSRRFGANTSADRITEAEFTAIANGGNLYNLSGSGSGGAVVSQGTKANVMNGTVDMSVRVGQGILPTWSSDVNLDSVQGDSLSFKADGGIQGGKLTEGNLGSYSLNAFGQAQGSPSSSQVGGSLVGPGIRNPAKPISGATIEFQFDHGDSGPRVIGAGGADLN